MALPLNASKVQPDSLDYHRLEVVEVTGDPLRLPAEAGPVLLDARRIRDAAGGSVADLGALLPSTRLTVNSRGEGLFMLRGAPERHLPVYLEGIPLTLPWDERADLSMLSTQALGGMSARRGVESVLQGAGSLAGRLDLDILHRREDGSGSRFALRFGELGSVQASAVRLVNREGSEWTASLSHRQREAWILPCAYHSEFNQGTRAARNNSDLRQTAFMLGAKRAMEGQGEWSFILHAMDGSKGVPPETHLEDARFWRIPIHRRLLLGLSRKTANHDWRSEVNVSMDLFGQNIRTYPDASFAEEPPQPGQDYEQDRDFTSFASLRIDHLLADDRRLGLLMSLRYARHKESLLWRGDWSASSQILTSLTAEWRGGSPAAWRYQLGCGYERSDMPESGLAAERSGLGASVMQAGIAHEMGKVGELRISLSRRSRFPSMREMFSTGLGKFHPNPNLNSETQNLADAGLSMRGERSELWIGAFASFLEGGVEKVPYGGEGARFQRVNRDEIRVLGLEFMLGWRPLPGVHLGLQHSQFDAWAREVGGDELSAEDRPDYLSRFSLAWTRAGGLRLRLEAAMTGPRFSAHPEDGLTRLPSEGSASLRVGHILRLETWMPGSDIEVYLRIDNLFDSIRLSQVGLPEAGRSLQAGCNLALRG